MFQRLVLKSLSDPIFLFFYPVSSKHKTKHFSDHPEATKKQVVNVIKAKYRPYLESMCGYACESVCVWDA